MVTSHPVSSVPFALSVSITSSKNITGKKMVKSGGGRNTRKNALFEVELEKCAWTIISNDNNCHKNSNQENY